MKTQTRKAIMSVVLRTCATKEIGLGGIRRCHRRWEFKELNIHSGDGCCGGHSISTTVLN